MRLQCRRHLKAVLSVVYFSVLAGSSSALLSPKFTWVEDLMLLQMLEPSSLSSGDVCNL
ncbi:hypothetical protein RchiOBHm_Chr2g0131591 [Rosa chinensis]|uniref:Uncharacterized protein n=1 Tax=Rosa chinensis TaxID=74649 RepID=A0A2P6RV54_ROSCH|nr:hypothetical protein RchiOBHm_Chr2g0131591 [Rosa chinensis]